MTRVMTRSSYFVVTKWTFLYTYVNNAVIFNTKKWVTSEASIKCVYKNQRIKAMFSS